MSAPHEPQSLKDLLTPITESEAKAPLNTKARAVFTHPMMGSLLVASTILLAINLVLLMVDHGTPSAARPTVAITSTSAPATSVPTPTPTRVSAPAYWSPNGATIGTVAIDKRTIIGTQPGWVQLLLDGGGKVWVRDDITFSADETTQLAALRTPPTAPPSFQLAGNAVPTPTDVPPPPCVANGIGDRIVTVCDYLPLEQLNAEAARQWAAKYGGNVGRGDVTPTPDFMQATAAKP